jgi:acyl-CoA hydrolase
MKGLEPIYRLTANIGKIPGLENAKVGEKVEFEARISITGTSLEVDVYHNEELVSTGVTRVPTIVKTKYVKGTSGEEKKKKWRVPIFSLIRNY